MIHLTKWAKDYGCRQVRVKVILEKDSLIRLRVDLSHYAGKDIV